MPPIKPFNKALNLYHNFAYFTLFIGSIPLLLFIVKKKGFSFKEPIAPFIWLTGFATVYEFTGTLLLNFNATYWSQLYSLLEFVTIYYFFFKLFHLSYKKALTLFIVLLLFTYCMSFVFWSSNNIFISEAANRIPLTLFIFTFSFIWFKELFNKMEILNPWQHHTFYFVSGLAIYYSATTFLFVLSSFIFESNLYFYDYWLVNVMATFILRLFLIIGVWKMEQG